MSGRAAKRHRRDDRAKVRGYLERVITRLRALLKREAPAVLAAAPDHRRPCHTCAFNPGTDRMQGFDTTVLGLASAIEQGNPFFCHEPLPKGSTGDWEFDPAKAQLCAGYAMLRGALPDAKRAIVRAITDRELTDDQADALRARMPGFPRPGDKPRIAPGVDLEEARRVIEAHRP